MADIPSPDPELEDDALSDPLAAWEEAKVSQLGRIQEAHDSNTLAVIGHAGVIMIVFLWFFSALFVLSIGFWFWHFLMPPSLTWMTDAQLGKIQAVIFSGSMGAILTTLAQRYFGRSVEKR